MIIMKIKKIEDILLLRKKALQDWLVTYYRIESHGLTDGGKDGGREDDVERDDHLEKNITL